MDPKLATKHELDTIYTIDDLYDFLETLDAFEFLAEEADKAKEHAKQQQLKQQENRIGR